MATNTVKKFFEILGLAFATDAVKGFILKCFEERTAAETLEAINKNVNLWEVTPISIKDQVNTLRRRFQKYETYIKQFQGMITDDSILEWLRIRRPDLASVIINTKNGKAWLGRQIDIIFDNLENGGGG